MKTSFVWKSHLWCTRNCSTQCDTYDDVSHKLCDFWTGFMAAYRQVIIDSLDWRPCKNCLSHPPTFGAFTNYRCPPTFLGDFVWSHLPDFIWVFLMSTLSWFDCTEWMLAWGGKLCWALRSSWVQFALVVLGCRTPNTHNCSSYYCISWLIDWNTILPFLMW